MGKWSQPTELNREPSAYETGALPIELGRRNNFRVETASALVKISLTWATCPIEGHYSVMRYLVMDVAEFLALFSRHGADAVKALKSLPFVLQFTQFCPAQARQTSGLFAANRHPFHSGIVSP